MLILQENTVNKLKSLEDVLERESLTDKSTIVEEGGENLLRGCGNILQATSSKAAVYDITSNQQETEKPQKTEDKTELTAKEQVCVMKLLSNPSLKTYYSSKEL